MGTGRCARDVCTSAEVWFWAGEQVIIAESYGGRDEPVDTLVGSLVDINVTPVFDPLRVKAVPTEDIYQVLMPSCLNALLQPFSSLVLRVHWGLLCKQRPAARPDHAWHCKLQLFRR